MSASINPWTGAHIDPNIKGAFGWVASALSYTLFLSPIKTFWEIARVTKDTGQYIPLPYLMGVVNCVFWSLWAFVTPNRISPIVTNVGGAVICFAIYVKDAALKRRFLLQLSATALLCAAGIAVAIAVRHCPDHAHCDKPFHAGEPQNHAANVLGIVANVGNIFMYGAPLAIMREVVRTKSVRFMPFLLTLTVFLSSVAWLGYGTYVGDVFISIPNACGPSVEH